MALSPRGTISTARVLFDQLLCFSRGTPQATHVQIRAVSEARLSPMSQHFLQRVTHRTSNRLDLSCQVRAIHQRPTEQVSSTAKSAINLTSEGFQIGHAPNLRPPNTTPHTPNFHAPVGHGKRESRATSKTCWLPAPLPWLFAKTLIKIRSSRRVWPGPEARLRGGPRRGGCAGPAPQSPCCGREIPAEIDPFTRCAPRPGRIIHTVTPTSDNQLPHWCGCPLSDSWVTMRTCAPT